MGRKKVIGTCQLCRKENIKLTFEHVPPRTIMNNEALKVHELLDIIDMDITGPVIAKFRNLQRGAGDYFLCAQCNNITGSKYIPSLTAFLYEIYSHINDMNQRDTIDEVSINFEIPASIFSNIQKEMLLNILLINRSTIPDSISRWILDFNDKRVFSELDNMNVLTSDLYLFAINKFENIFAMRQSGPMCIFKKGIGVVNYCYMDHFFYKVVFTDDELKDYNSLLKVRIMENGNVSINVPMINNCNLFSPVSDMNTNDYYKVMNEGGTFD